MSKELSFWDGVRNVDGSELTENQKLEFCTKLCNMLYQSPELAKIFFNTQVYNVIENGVTTRGSHSEGVAIVAENLARMKAQLDGKSGKEGQISGLLARALGYMHDMGHTPFGHDGEGALGREMERFDATEEYKEKRKALFGEEYTIQAEDVAAEVMCYEHNETSAVIGAQLVENFAKEFGVTLSPEAVQYIKTGILSHSTSRVKTEPDGVEQKAVRLADKVAYIPQDLLDLLKQSVLSIDDLVPEEQALLGLDESTLTQSEQEFLDECSTQEERDEYIAECSARKRDLKNQLRNFADLDEDIRKTLVDRLDSLVGQMQAEIASKCFVERDGEHQLDGRKNVVDVIDKYINKNEKPEGRLLTPEETRAAELFQAVRDAQKLPMDNPDRQAKVDETSRAYMEYLISAFDMNPTMAALWVTKAKYQDSFIKNELARVSSDGQSQETLGDINKRYDNGWKMKATFQFFLCNPDQIPQDFMQKYQRDGEQIYTDQQIVSAFIASFTNEGLNELYNGLLEKKLVMSREETITQLQAARPDIDVAKLSSKDYKWVNPQNKKEKVKFNANDMLEFMFEESVGSTIVAGKIGPDGKKKIPDIRHKIAVRDHAEQTCGRQSEEVIQENPELLVSAIDVSRTEINSTELKALVQSVIEKQKSEEIDVHISKARKKLESEGQEL